MKTRFSGSANPSATRAIPGSAECYDYALAVRIGPIRPDESCWRQHHQPSAFSNAHQPVGGHSMHAPRSSPLAQLPRLLCIAGLLAAGTAQADLLGDTIGARL